MSQQDCNEAVSKLLEATNALNVKQDLSSAFKKSTNHAKFSPKNLIKKMATVESNSAVCGRDIHFLIKFYLHLTSEDKLNMTSEGYEEYQILTKKYNIEKKPLDDNITLHRIAAAFPIVSVNLLREYKIDRKFSNTMLKEKDAANFPWCMRTQMCLSLAPKEPHYIRDPEYKRLVYAIIVFMYYENKIVVNSKTIASPMQTFEKVLSIANTIYNDSILDPDKQKHAWNKVMFDYVANKRSVDSLLKSFRSELPEAEASFMKKFNFFDGNARMTEKKKYYNKSAKSGK